MSTNGTFEVEDCDIVRLDGRLDGESVEHERAGWVNVGAFALRIDVSQAGDLTVNAYPIGNEGDSLAQFSVTRAAAMAAGAQPQENDE